MTEDGGIHSYAPGEDHGLHNDPFNAIVGPRPIGWISTLSGEGRRNLAPYSFFNALNYKPPLIGFSSIAWKDSVANIEASGEFVWNLVTRDLVEAMNISSAAVPPHVDEFELAGLTPAASRLVKPPRVKEAAVAFECRLAALHRLCGADREPVDSWLAIGEVKMIHIAKRLIKDGRYATARARPILRGGGGAEYFEVDEKSRFELRRPADR